MELRVTDNSWHYMIKKNWIIFDLFVINKFRVVTPLEICDEREDHIPITDFHMHLSAIHSFFVKQTTAYLFVAMTVGA
ncbi:hypothetical protein V1478_007386 [Vespula squamosa]|uniref:Uncharacterized protein n=1 Tax=Vespula squamosa TaxID=30214 RepID=A0ABD2B2Z0_VESSQ